MKRCLRLSLWLLLMMSMTMGGAMNRRERQLLNKKYPSMVKVEIKTSLGEIVIGLYNETPKHRDNFVKHVKAGDYDGVLFHRVINNFMIQSGDPQSKHAQAGQMLGASDSGSMIDAEIVCPRYFHKRGALAAARTGDDVNPERRSSGSQFYIVTGKVFNDSSLAQLGKRMAAQQQQSVFRKLMSSRAKELMTLQKERDSLGVERVRQELIAATEVEVAKHPVTFTEEQKHAYKTVGGAPHLDGGYTVYGEVLEGMDVVDKIQTVKTDKYDRPLTDVKILSMKILK